MHSTSALQTASVFVVDSWPVIERLLRRWSNPSFESLLTATSDGSVRLLMHEVNLGEIFYLVTREQGTRAAEKAVSLIAQVGIEVISVQAGDALRAASLKAQFTMSYADCFCANLAIVHSAPVLTGDPDFLKLQAAGLLQVEWLGA